MLDFGVDVEVRPDAEVDVAVAPAPAGGRPLLILSPAQSFTNAVQAVQRAIPDMHPDQARALVRTYLPNAFGLRDLTDTAPPPRPIVPRRRRFGWVAGVVTAVVAVAGMGGGWWVLASHERAELAAEGAVWPGPESQPVFRKFIAAAGLDCDLGGTVTRCTDLDGHVVTVEWSMYSDRRWGATLSYGEDRLVLRRAVDAAAARAFAAEEGVQKNHPDGITLRGAWLGWGTDQAAIQRYLDLVGGV